MCKNAISCRSGLGGAWNCLKYYCCIFGIRDSTRSFISQHCVCGQLDCLAKSINFKQKVFVKNKTHACRRRSSPVGKEISFQFKCNPLALTKVYYNTPYNTEPRDSGDIHTNISICNNIHKSLTVSINLSQAGCKVKHFFVKRNGFGIIWLVNRQYCWRMASQDSHNINFHLLNDFKINPIVF